ncbi:hypothetical protein [Streptomyces sp. NPDC093223]|uniref:hypothetical protein n=1 Tax=Streptomyces sp. NPDC093223 TaxID=3366033 RepID=UPI00380492F5
MTTFTDSFNRANGAPGANWVDGTGLWTIVSNQLSPGTAGGTIVIRTASGMATNDNSAQITIAATGAVSHGVWCRGNTGFTQGYLWRNDGTSWVLFSNIGGSFTSLGSFSGAAVAGDVAKITAVGSTITGYINGIARVTVTNAAVTTGTFVGLRAESSNVLRFDDFTGSDVTSGVTGDAALGAAATLTASGVRATTGAAALAASAALTASGIRATVGDANFAATATLSAAGVRATASDASLSISAGLTADGVRSTSGSASLAGTAGLAADGVRATLGAASLSVAAGLSADGVRGVSGAASLAASASLTASGTVVTSGAGDASLAATAALTASGSIGRRLDASLTGTAVLVAAGSIGATGGGVLAVSAGLHASGQVSGAIARGSARQAAGVHPAAARGEPADPRARAGRPAVPKSTGGTP